jgi:hypothetical protein
MIRTITAMISAMIAIVRVFMSYLRFVKRTEPEVASPRRFPNLPPAGARAQR